MSIIEKIKQKGTGKTASEADIKSAEQYIGYPFPAILRSIYSTVANGGIGPGYRLLGVDGGHLSDEGDTISELYLDLCASDEYDELWLWPRGTVPFCHWGSSVYSCYDATKSGNPVVWFDPNVRDMGEPMEKQFKSHKDSLESWFQGWLSGEKYRA